MLLNGPTSTRNYFVTVNDLAPGSTQSYFEESMFRFNRVLNAHAEMKMPNLYNNIIKEPSGDD